MLRIIALAAILSTTFVAQAAKPMVAYMYKVEASVLQIDPRAINDRGQIAGMFVAPSGDTFRGFVTGPLGKGFTEIAGPNPEISTIAWGINNDGTVVGETGDLTPKQRAFVLTKNGIMNLLFAGRNSAGEIAADINNAGQVLVIANKTTDDGSLKNESFISDTAGLSVLPLQDLGGGAFFARAINERGQVAGMSLTAEGRYHAVVTGAQGTPTFDLGDFGTDQAYSSDINGRGDVVGYTITYATGQRSAFILRSGAPQPEVLENLGAPFTSGRAIAPNGAIAGYATLADRTRVGMAGNPQGELFDINTVIRNAPAGVRIVDVKAINSKYQAAALGSDGNAYIVCPIRNCK